MKYFLIIIFFFAETVYATAQEKIHWLTLKEATARNLQEPKKFLIDVYTDWCGWCKRMDATTFEDKAVVSYVNKNFYAVKLDAETKDTVFYKDMPNIFLPEYKANEIALKLLNGKMGYPTSVYLDEKMDLIAPVQGYLDKDQIIKVMKYFAENIYQTIKWEDYVKENYSK